MGFFYFTANNEYIGKDSSFLSSRKSFDLSYFHTTLILCNAYDPMWISYWMC